MINVIIELRYLHKNVIVAETSYQMLEVFFILRSERV